MDIYVFSNFLIFIFSLTWLILYLTIQEFKLFISLKLVITFQNVLTKTNYREYPGPTSTNQMKSQKFDEIKGLANYWQSWARTRLQAHCHQGSSLSFPAADLFTVGREAALEASSDPICAKATRLASGPPSAHALHWSFRAAIVTCQLLTKTLLFYFFKHEKFRFPTPEWNIYCAK